jgi:hypothetical protein
LHGLISTLALLDRHPRIKVSARVQSWDESLCRKAAETFLHCSNIVVNGFTPGTIYYARLRGVGTNGPGVWAVSAGVMAV